MKNKKEVERNAADVKSGEFSWEYSGSVIPRDTLRTLEGKLLTQVDASVPEHTQREALKSVVRNIVWDWFEETTRFMPMVSITFIENADGTVAGQPLPQPKVKEVKVVEDDSVGVPLPV